MGNVNTVILNAVFIIIALTIALRWLMPEKITALVSPYKGYKNIDRQKPGKKNLLVVFLLCIGFRLIMFLFAAVLIKLDILKSSGYGFLSLHSNWDARHYLNLAELGYGGYVEDGRHLFLVFFPLYPWLMRIFSLIIPNMAIAGLTISVLSYAWGCVWLYRLAFERYDAKTAANSVLLLSVFPFSFFFGGIMTEGVFLLASCASLYFIHRNKWLAAGLWGILACLSRMAGVVLVVAAFVELWEKHGAKPKSGKPLGKSIAEVLKRLPLILLPLTGTGIYLGLNYYIDKNPFAFTIHQQHWYQGFKWFSETIGYITKNIFNYGSDPVNFAVWIPELIIFISFSLILLRSIFDKENPNFLLVYALAYLIMNFSMSWLLSAGRYFSCAAPFFIFTAVIAGRKKPAVKLLACVSSIFMALYYSAHLAGSQVF